MLTKGINIKDSRFHLLTFVPGGVQIRFYNSKGNEVNKHVGNNVHYPTKYLKNFIYDYKFHTIKVYNHDDNEFYYAKKDGEVLIKY